MSLGTRLAIAIALFTVIGNTREASAQNYPYYPAYQLNRFYYYPYVYFPHNYWPVVSPRWPEQQGMPYMRPPAYQAWPPFRDPDYHYEHKQNLRFYRGFHFWLDQF